MRSLNMQLALMAAAALATSGAMERDHYRRIDAPSWDDDIPLPRKRRAQTETINPADLPLAVSRQVRRQRERLAAKGRNDAFVPIRMGRSKYTPHVGKKERGRYDA